MTVKELSPQKSFVSRILASKPLYIYSSSDKNGNVCWFIIRSDERSIEKLKQTTDRDTINIRDYGEVIKAGLGKSPDKKIVESCG